MGVDQYPPNFRVEEDVAHQSFIHGEIGEWMPYNFVADCFHTKTLCSRLSSSVNWTFLLGATAEVLRANIDWNSVISLQRFQLGPKFKVEGIV